MSSSRDLLRTEEMLLPPMPEAPKATAEHIPALLGLRRFITAMRLAYTSETLDDKIVHDAAIKSSAVEAMNVRSFKSTPELRAINKHAYAEEHKCKGFDVRPESGKMKEFQSLAPMTFTERWVRKHRVKQGHKMHELEHEQSRIAIAYGKKPKVELHAAEELEQMTPEQRARALRKEAYAQKMAEPVHDLGSSAHKKRLFGGPSDDGESYVAPDSMVSGARSAQLKAARRDRQLRGKIHGKDSHGDTHGGDDSHGHGHGHGSTKGLEGILHRAAVGDTAHGRRRMKSIGKSTDKKQRLEGRLQELRRLTVVRDSRRSRRP